MQTAMNPYASDNYLVTEVMTAPPQKMQLMLIDAAIRKVRCAQEHWEDKIVTGRCIRHAQKIISGILDGIDFSAKSPLASKVAHLYLFVYASLARGAVDNDPKQIAEALRILEIERETWRQVCEKLGGAPAAPNLAAHFPLADNLVDSSFAGLSLEA
jgi:flagellar secretion chaperone FliS